MKQITSLFILAITALSLQAAPNVLVIAADDMNWDSVGCFAAPMKGLTPHIDQLAADGIRFDRAHVASTVCQPSRMAINSGRLPHRSGGEGFHHFRFPDVPTIPNTLTKHGYKVGILGKVKHSTPYEDTPWDLAEEVGRNTEDIADKAAAFMKSAQSGGKPFYLIVNSHDPHRPYYKHTSKGTTMRGSKDKPANSHPSRVIQPDEVIVPEFVPDTPAVRSELADYYCSVRRCDDVVGAVLAKLDTLGLAKDTLVVFLSDHGMGAPSAKGNAYLNSTKTPMVARWPRGIKPGQVCTDFTSSLDLFPTLLAAAKIPSPGGFDGTSLLPAFAGQSLAGRDTIFFTQFYTNIGKNLFNMRTAHQGQFSYTYNTFCNGDRLYSGSSLGGAFFQSMVEAGKTNPKWAARAEHILRRTPEELYNIEKDPSCMNNLIDNPEYAPVIKKFQKEMGAHFKAVSDPVESVYTTYIKTGSMDKMRAEYEKVVESGDMIGHIPNEVNMEKYTDPEAFKAKRKPRKKKK